MACTWEIVFVTIAIVIADTAVAKTKAMPKIIAINLVPIIGYLNKTLLLSALIVSRCPKT
jgi:hypothetical protein